MWPLTVTVNKLANTTSIHLGYNTSLPFATIQPPLHCKHSATQLILSQEQKQGVGAQAGNRRECLLCLGGCGRAAFKR